MTHECKSKHVSASLKASFSFYCLTEQSLSNNFRKSIMDPSILALMDDSFDLWLAEDWTARQGDEFMPSEDENELLIAACRVEQEEQREGRPAKNKPGNKSFEQLLKKKSVITIKNTDELCLARALVTTKEYVDGDPDKQYANLRQGYPIQERLARLFHREAGVPEGPCGLPEIQKMQHHLGAQGYQIKIFEGICGTLWFCDEMYDDAPKKLCLLKLDEQFHGLRSVRRILAFLKKSYY